MSLAVEEGAARPISDEPLQLNKPDVEREFDVSTGSSLSEKLEHHRNGIEFQEIVSSDPTGVVTPESPSSFLGEDMVLPGKCVNVVDINQNLFLVNCKLNGYTVPAMIDTGLLNPCCLMILC